MFWTEQLGTKLPDGSQNRPRINKRRYIAPNKTNTWTLTFQRKPKTEFIVWLDFEGSTMADLYSSPSKCKNGFDIYINKDKCPVTCR